MKFKAFVSYSHQADARLAPALQRGLQRFAKPWYGTRAMQLFRDQTDLTVAPGLWPEIVRALEDSEFLLVLASPAGAASKWIDREIGWWLEHRGPAQLLIVLTEGALVWDEARGGFSLQESSALNPRLANAFDHEPLWLDLRWARDETDLTLGNGRFQESVADVSAALNRVPKDTLIGEDQRQHRHFRYAAWTMVSLLAVLAVAAAVLGLLASQQRDTAERRLVDLLYVPAGLQALREDDPAAALLWFVEALRLDEGDTAREPIHRSRIAAVLASHPRLVDVRWHDGRVVDVQIGSCGDLLSASRDGVVRLGRPFAPALQAFDLREQGRLVQAGLAADGSRVLALSADASDQRLATLWDAATASPIPWSLSAPIQY